MDPYTALIAYTGFGRRRRIGSRGSQGRGRNEGTEVLLSKIRRLAYCNMGLA